MAKEVHGQPRKRGRPPGSGGIDDARELAAVADLLAAEKAKTPRAAMKRAVKGIGDSHLRRLQARWKDQGEALLAAARERLRRREAAKGRVAVTLDRGAWSSLPPVPSLTDGWRKAAAAAGGIEPLVPLLGRTMAAGLNPAMGRLAPPPASVVELSMPRLSGSMAEASKPLLGRTVAGLADEPRISGAVYGALNPVGQTIGAAIAKVGVEPLLGALGSTNRLFRDPPPLGIRDPLLPSRR